ncbi:hypothetical protein BUALT_Bualt13G0012000 [Buddleja alternifolia]|uniref:Peptidase A1 domain-containing protein n=1 Tax=Buddleja alternifolia TaxID=168488 RepID=A0AAV6WSB5_9LAMI|nr:hypothetical protein BUALT_Bualt13G0012000 [Buddleja alternifolia]
MLIYLKTPLQPSNFHLDLGSYLPWYDCVRHYNKSSSYKPVYSNTTLCDNIRPGMFSNCFEPPGPGCFNDSCGFFPENPVSRKSATGNLLVDKFAVLKEPGRPGLISELVFACTDASPYAKMYRGLARGSTGLAALGRFNYSLPAQISRVSSSPQIFVVCLPSSSKSKGIRILRHAFVKESNALNLTLIKPVEPFRVCYAADRITNTVVGPRVPTIDLVLQSDEVFWRIYGSNSMVRIRSENVDSWCLGFVDGGIEPKTSIVIGGHQFEDNLLQFDLEHERLGFSSSLLSRSTNCANFDPNIK